MVAASQLLKGILRLPWKVELTENSPHLIAEGAALDEESQEFLTPFLCGRAPGASFVRTTTDVSPHRIDWSPFGLSYAEWLPKIASSMCALDKSDAVWSLCQDMARLKLDFAELIFPSLVFGVYLTAREQDQESGTAFREEFGTALRECLISDARIDVKIQRLILSVLEYFRLFRLQILRRSQEMDKELCDEVLKWKSCYWCV